MLVRYTDEVILKGLRERNSDFIEYFYKEYFPQVRSIVVRNSGNFADAQDVFHDGILVIYNQLCEGTLRLSCTLKTYFYAVCQRIWMRRLERKRRLLYQEESLVEEGTSSYIQGHDEIDEEKLEMTRMMSKHFENLPSDCRKLLMLYSQKTPYTQIAEIMRFKDASYVKTRKYMCKNLLRKRILNDPAYKHFLQYD